MAVGGPVTSWRRMLVVVMSIWGFVDLGEVRAYRFSGLQLSHISPFLDILLLQSGECYNMLRDIRVLAPLLVFV